MHSIIIDIKATQSYLIACEKQELDLDHVITESQNHRITEW